MALTRTQISLSESQRRFLQRLARQQGRSVSDIIRSFVEKEMQSQNPVDDPLFEIVGLADGREQTVHDSLDRRLYKKDWT